MSVCMWKGRGCELGGVMCNHKGCLAFVCNFHLHAYTKRVKRSKCSSCEEFLCPAHPPESLGCCVPGCKGAACTTCLENPVLLICGVCGDPYCYSHKPLDCYRCKEWICETCKLHKTGCADEGCDDEACSNCLKDGGGLITCPRCNAKVCRDHMPHGCQEAEQRYKQLCIKAVGKRKRAE